MIERMRSCCGIGEMQGLDRSGEQSLIRAWRDLKEQWREHYKMVVFTDALGNRCGKNLHRYLTENNLGRVDMSEAVRNPNTGRKVALWTWYPDYKALRRWYKKILNDSKKNT